MTKIFFDTDIILDNSIARSVDIKDSAKALSLAERGLFKGYTSTIIFSNAYYLQRKFIGHEAAINFLKDLRLLLAVLSVDDPIIEKALASDFSDFEDAIQYYTALSNEMDCIITRNVNDFKKSAIPVYTPTELLKVIKG